ncbi:MAG: hypothetical protein OXI56_06425 [bacterium]|nr:hypothetical protein [bacterium]
MVWSRKPGGEWRYRVLGIRCAVDPVLHALAPLGLAAARGTALVVDLDDEAPAYPGSTSLAKLVVSQPRLSHLRPHRPGVAMLPNGSVRPGEAAEVIEALVAGWPAVVLRYGTGQSLPPVLLQVPVVPVAPLLPGFLHPPLTGAAVYQSLFSGPPPRLRGVVLPPLGRSHIQGMLTGRGFPPRRWVRAWERVWEVSWR